MPFFMEPFLGFNSEPEVEYLANPLDELLGLRPSYPTFVAAPVQHHLRRQPSFRPVRRQRSCVDNLAAYMNNVNAYADDQDDEVYFHPYHGFVKRAPVQRRAQQTPQQLKRPAPPKAAAVPAASQPKPQTQSPTPTITMRAIENENDYTVIASLPGFDRRDISLSFDEPQTLTISGKLVERQTVPAAPIVEEKKTKEEEPKPKPKKLKKYQATVEDDTDDDDYSVVSTPSASSRRSSTVSEASSGTFSDVVEKEEPTEPQPQQQPSQQQETKVEEKVVAEFSRKAQFPGPVEVSKVQATFNDVEKTLTVKVPKRPKFQAQRIGIF